MLLQKNLSNSLNRIRASRNQTLDEFSEELGISRSYLQKILNGTSNPTVDTIEQIARELHTDPASLLFPPDADTISLARIVHKVSYLDPEKQQRVLADFQEITMLLKTVNEDV